MRRLGTGATVLVALLATPLAGQEQQQVDVSVEPVGEGVWMLTGQGGNIGIAAGEDAVFIVDDQYAPLTDRIVAAIGELGFGDVDFVLNTHWHGDHTGGNENLGRAGALIVAHRSVRDRMSSEQFIESLDLRVEASPPEALPVVTFTTDVAFHINGQEVEAIHVPAAHTDGDALVIFRGANVIHMGDTFFPGRYPFIDLSSGGSIDGVIAATEAGMALADENTRFIPGHGPVSSVADLETYRDVLSSVRQTVAAMIEEGMSEDAVVAAGPTAEWDETWGAGFINPEAFVRSVYGSIVE
jgi:glyoxylase-like metal-dependent hydrolase (beta-lactamase superfamily II)